MEVSAFTQMLLDISEDLTADDLKLMKFALDNEDHLQERALEEATKGVDIFRLLRKRNLLSADNLGLLKSIFATIKRRDLAEKVSAFENANQRLENPVHPSGPVLQETGFEENFEREVDTSKCQSELQRTPRAADISPDVLSPHTSINSQDTQIKQRRCNGPSNVPPNDQSLRPSQEQSLSTAGSSLEPCAQSFHCGLAELVENDANESTGEVCSEGSEIVHLAEEHQLSADQRSIIYLRDDRSLDVGSDFDALDKPSLCSYQDALKNPSLCSDQDVLKKPSLCSDQDVLKKPSLCSDQDALKKPSLCFDQDALKKPSLCSDQDALKEPSLCSDQDLSGNEKCKALRGYQLELAQPSLRGSNSIICAPTGSGKTFTAGFIFQQHWKLAKHEGRNFCGLFVVCQRTLVLQQRRALEEFLPPDVVVGSVDENQLLTDVLLLPFSLIVLTAQKLINALDGGSVKVEQFGMLIMDECHHTDLNHPYNKIMRFYHRIRRDHPDVQLPMIVGLTASLGVGSGKHETAPQQHYINICANLNANCITHVRNKENEYELLRFNPKPSEDQIRAVDPRPKNCPFYAIMIRLMGKIESESELIYSKPHERGTQSYENWVVSRKQEAVQRDNLPHIIIACESLEKLNIAWMLHDQLRIKDAKEYLDSHFTSEWLPLQPLKMQKYIFTNFLEASEHLDRLVGEETTNQCPQLNELCKLLMRIHSNHSDARGILLARTRLSVDRLIQFLGELMEFHGVIFPAKFVGQGGNEGAMTQTEQENTLRRFRLGKEDPSRINLLVATDVAQEGLDMPKCNYVIRYNFVSNEIGSVQSRGRARAPNSELYLIVTRGSINEARELENLQKEHQMQEALKAIDTIPQEQLEQSIKAVQDKNWQDYESQLKRDLMRASAVNCDLVTIHCSKCKEFLCNATDMRLRGSNYICIAEDFENRTVFKETPGGKEFINEIHLGQICCKAEGCPGNKLGLKVKYKQGCRPFGFVLGKDGCVWRTKGREGFVAIKQWSKVSFTIEKENI